MSETTANYVCPIRATKREIQHLYAKGTVPKGSGDKILNWLNAGIEEKQELLEAAKRMDALMDSLWKSVPWGKTWDLDVQALNEVPPALKRAIAKAEGRQS